MYGFVDEIYQSGLDSQQELLKQLGESLENEHDIGYREIAENLNIPPKLVSDYFQFRLARLIRKQEYEKYSGVDNEYQAKLFQFNESLEQWASSRSCRA